MLDVHPPHAPTHTWRDFFIHIATICVGLLIAIGLEQTVEAIHHHEQRLQLEEDLRKDSKVNEVWAADSLHYLDQMIDWASEEALTVEHGGPVGHLTLRQSPPGDVSNPNTGVWIAAKGNGQVNLLTGPRQNWLNDLDWQETNAFVGENSGRSHFIAAELALDLALRGQVTSPATGAELDLSNVGPAQRARVQECLQNLAEAAIHLQSEIISWDTSNRLTFSSAGEQPDDLASDRLYEELRKQTASKYHERHLVFTPE